MENIILYKRVVLPWRKIIKKLQLALEMLVIINFLCDSAIHFRNRASEQRSEKRNEKLNSTEQNRNLDF